MDNWLAWVQLDSAACVLSRGVMVTAILTITKKVIERLLREIERYLNIGVTYFTVCFPDLPDTRSLQLFAEHIIRHFRNRSYS